MMKLSLNHKNEPVSVKSYILSGLVAASVLATLYVSWIPFSSPSVQGEPPTVQRSDESKCGGRRIFIYDLPPEFNVDIVNSWCLNSSTSEAWMCDFHLQNNGLGLPARVSDAGAPDAGKLPPSSLTSNCKLLPARSWFRTGQFSLELLLHQRFKSYDCLTEKPQDADLFYVPYYVGTDIRRNLFNDHVQLRDKLVQRLIGYLEASPSWGSSLRRSRHVMVLSRIAWDFRRIESTEAYGSALLQLPETKNMTKLIIERDPWDASQVAVPYPTGFHPRDESETLEWIQHVKNSRRVFRVSFAGSPPRTHKTEAGELRGILRKRCEEHAECQMVKCEKVDCQANPEVANCLALESTFCLVPPGDSPTRKGLFDSLLSGCVPVLFDRHTAETQYLWHLPRNTSEYSVYFPQAHVINGSVDVIRELAGLDEARVSSLQERIREIIPRIVYGLEGTSTKDAFNVIVQNLMN